MEVTRENLGVVEDLDPVVTYEETDYGWRGLTANGEVLEVRSANGRRATVPESIVVSHRGKIIGRREVTRQYEIKIEDYVQHYDRAVTLFRECDFDQALVDLDAAIELAPTAAAKFNRGLVLLSMGRWHEGFVSYEARLDLMTPPMCRGLELPRWRGEDLRGKNLLLVHDAGFGDTVMMLRYVPKLYELGANVRLMVPPELERLADQVAPTTKVEGSADYFCPMLSLLHLLDQTTESVPSGPYLHVNRSLVERWRGRVDPSRKKVGVAWSVGRAVEGDYPRAMPLADMLARTGDAEVHSVQVQDGAVAARHGVIDHDFEDFADCAALISLMDQIVTVDTAAAHVAGAIGHPDVTVLLSYWASWRWRDNPFYPEVKLCRQES